LHKTCPQYGLFLMVQKHTNEHTQSSHSFLMAQRYARSLNI